MARCTGHRVEEVQHIGLEVTATGVELLLDRIKQVQHPGREVMVVMVWMDLIMVKATKVVDREGKEDFVDNSIRSNPKII